MFMLTLVSGSSVITFQNIAVIPLFFVLLDHVPKLLYIFLAS